MKRKENTKAITLVALVITIIVLLILAGVTISLTIGQNGIITKAQEAGKNYLTAQNQELAGMNEFEKNITNIIEGINGSSETETIPEIEPAIASNWTVTDGYITKYTGDFSEFTGNKVIIPNQINGQKIVGIKQGNDSTKIFPTNGDGKNYELSKGLTVLGSGAFMEYNDIAVSIPNTITTMEDAIFYYSSIKGDLIIPDSVTSADYLANSTSIQGNVIIGNGITQLVRGFIESSTIGGNLVIGNGVKKLAESALWQNKISGNLILGNNIEEIGMACFMECDFKGDLIIPDSVKIIEEATFDSCKFNGNVIIGSGVKTIPRYMFQLCSSTGTVQIKEGLTQIDDKAFANSKFSQILLPSSVQTMSYEVFTGFTNAQTISIKGIAENAIPSGWDAEWKTGCNAKFLWNQ